MKFKIASKLLTGICLCLLSVMAFGQTQPTLQDMYPKRVGNLRFSATTLSFGKIRNNIIRVDTIRMYNSGSKSIRIATAGKIPAAVQVSIPTPEIGPSQAGFMLVQYDPSKKNDYGFVLDRFFLNTNDTIQPSKNINITANIQPSFPPMTAADSAVIQKSRMPMTVYDYGNIHSGEKAVHDFMLYNDGKSDLRILKSKTSCVCMKTTFGKEVVPAGDSTNVRVEFDSYGKEGNDSRKVNLYVNDPARPEVVLEMKGMISK